MKTFLVKDYTFSPNFSALGSVDIYSIPNFRIERLVSIINATAGKLIYCPAVEGLRYTSLTGSQVFLNLDTSVMSSTDLLMILYEDPTAILTNSAAQGYIGDLATDQGVTVMGVDSTGNAAPFKFDLSGNLKTNTDTSLLATEITANNIYNSTNTVANNTSIISSQLPLSRGTQLASNSMSVTPDSSNSIFLANITGINLGSQVGLQSAQSTDRSSTATTSTVTTTIAPTSTSAITASVNVTVVSGTNPTLDVSVWESRDGGTNYERIYDLPRITATGAYYVPLLLISGNRYRYVQTITGTTPSFTYSINTMRRDLPTAPIMRQLIDRTLVGNTLNSVTPTLRASHAKRLYFNAKFSAITTSPTLALEGSRDQIDWFTIGTMNVFTAGAAQDFTADRTYAFLRVRVTVVGTGATLDNIIFGGIQ